MKALLTLTKAVPAIRFQRHSILIRLHSQSDADKKESERLKQFREKLKEKPPEVHQEETQIGDKYLPPWPNNTNPKTGEIGGPKGPEPTRFGDWERKGRVSDF